MASLSAPDRGSTATMVAATIAGRGPITVAATMASHLDAVDTTAAAITDVPASARTITDSLTALTRRFVAAAASMVAVDSAAPEAVSMLEAASALAVADRDHNTKSQNSPRRQRTPSLLALLCGVCSEISFARELRKPPRECYRK